ncbi:M23 family metallopeptidase [Dyella sp. 2RAB6]|uniref:M23 family metallopeptidase n=1 Tax=Dyella sp. 2RAB6 TaxID=3232992 RepID=UPI003F934989
MIRRSALAVLVALSCCMAAVHAGKALAPVEARVPFAPEGFTGTDGAVHLAYELHISNFYGDTGVLKPKGLQVFADDAKTPLLTLDKNQLSQFVRPTPAEHVPVSIAPGKRAVVFVWITLPAGAAVPHTLRHHIEFDTEKKTVTTLDGAATKVGSQKPMTLGPPLRGGRWLAHEGPGNAHSHHWGSLVAVNGDLTIPQRYALDLVGVDASGHAMRPGIKDMQKTTYADWIGYGAEVIAVADGVVRDTRDGEQEHKPLSPQPEPASLTADGLFGNYVVLELQPGIFATYAHLKKGSVKVKPGDRIQRGQLLGQLGQSGNSAAPHLHFQLSTAVTFEGSEGLPYVFESFDYLGPESEAQLFGQGEAWKEPAGEQRKLQMPLNDVVVRFANP